MKRGLTFFVYGVLFFYITLICLVVSCKAKINLQKPRDINFYPEQQWEKTLNIIIQGFENKRKNKNSDLTKKINKPLFDSSPPFYSQPVSATTGNTLNSLPNSLTYAY